MNIQPTQTIQLDDGTYSVADMSPAVQQLVSYLDDWRQREANAASELLMIRSALRDAQNVLVETITQERATALKQANPGEAA